MYGEILELLGTINAILLAILIARAFSGQLIPLIKGIPLVLKTYKLTMKYHKVFAYALVFFGALHGFLLLGSIYLHTGWVLYGLILLTAALGVANKWIKRPITFKVHKYVALITLVAFVLHYLVRGLFN